MKAELEEIIEGSDMLTVDGFDDCVIGVSERCGSGDVLAYDTLKMIRKMVKRDKMTEEEAQEFFSFNISGAYMGEGTPVFITLLA